MDSSITSQRVLAYGDPSRACVDHHELNPGLGGHGESPPLELSRRFAGRLVEPMWANVGLQRVTGRKAVD
jgi:hypothetical protein